MQKSCSSSLQLKVNGKVYKISNPSPRESLADWLRKQPGLSGTKVMCREGGCGCCMVNIRKDGNTFAANSCLKPLCSLQGAEVVTVEGIGSSRNGFHSIQKRIADFNGSQCGYCTPGFVMAMHGLLSKNKHPDERTIESTFHGNICRCTGYRPILDAMKSFETNVDDIEDVVLCKSDCTQSCKWEKRIVCSTEDSSCSWFYPQSIDELRECFIQSDCELKIRCGNTGVLWSSSLNDSSVLDISHVKEFHLIEATNEALNIGAAMSLTKLCDLLKEHKDDSITFLPMFDHLQNVATPSVRNVASWAGNLMLKHGCHSFPSDILTIFIAAGVKLTIVDVKDGTTEVVKLTHKSFLKHNMEWKVITKASIPKFVKSSSASTQMKTYKVAPRSKNALALVIAGFRVTVKDNTLSDVVLSFGGMNDAFTNNYAIRTEKYLEGKALTQNTLTDSLTLLSAELDPVEANDSADSMHFKQNVALGCFYKFFLSLLDPSQVSERVRSALLPFQRGVSIGKQIYEEDKNSFPVNKAMPKVSSTIQASGEAYYSSDKAPTTDELFAVFVKSQLANADIDMIDVSQAVNTPGCHHVIYGGNFPSELKNTYHPRTGEVPIIATDHVDFAGQPVAIVIADSPENARQIARKVKVTYKSKNKPIITIEDAIENENFYPSCPKFKQGDAEDAINKADVKFSGEMNTGSQYHMYMELQYARCAPTDEGGFDVECGTQSQMTVQTAVAHTVGITCNKVNVTTKRIGGAFGGKAPNSSIVACGAAVSAYVAHRPVRLCADLQDCMESYGMRSQYKIKYTVGLNHDGKLQGIDCKIYSDCGSFGHEAELDKSIVLGWFDSAYFCPNRNVTPVWCKTNLPPISWFRCPGILQVSGFADNIMDHAAKELNMDPWKIKQANLYKDGQTTFGGDILQNCVMDRVVSDLSTNYLYEERKLAVDKFNAENKWKKKGLGLTPIRYGVFTKWATFTAQVAIFGTDGTVCISHGGIECGQGINTKVAQVAALKLGIDMSLISVQTTQTLTSPNSTDTGAAITSECCCMAVSECCKILKKRINPIRKKLEPEASWKEVIKDCAEVEVDLLATHQVAPRPETFCTYHVYAAALSEVELDVLTGQYQVKQVDIVYDCGKSLNPTVDIGQVEGGFVMGMGFWLSEKIVYDKETGKLLTNDTWSYHVPGSADIPNKWNIEFLKDSNFPTQFMRSKTAGEPPMCTSVSAFIALKTAIASYRTEDGDRLYVALDAPATVEDVYAKLRVNPIQDFYI